MEKNQSWAFLSDQMMYCIAEIYQEGTLDAKDTSFASVITMAAHVDLVGMATRATKVR